MTGPPVAAPAVPASNEARDFVFSVLAEIYEPREAPDIRTWIESKKIPVKATHNRQAAAAGKTWAFDDFPVMATWVFDFIQHPTSKVLFRDGTVREIRNRTAAVMKDAQSGLTSIMIHGLAWWIQWIGGNVIMMTATRDLARESGKDKIDLLDDYDELAAAKLESSTSMALRYPKSIVWLGGGQSSGSVISNPSSLNICDEVAKHTLVNGMIPMRLLEGRITADDDGKQISFSTPDNALEYAKNPITGELEPAVTIETAIHSSYLEGTQEVVEVPCPHCGHYQSLDWQRLQFSHCKESLPGSDKPIWNRDRVFRETWYQCANRDCTDRYPDGTVRGRIEEHHKRDMIDRRRYVATNLEYRSGHRTLQAGGLYNLAFAARSFGAIADAFLSARQEGGEAAMKAFMTDVIGIPFVRFKADADTLQQVKKLKRGYRRIGYDGHALLSIPLPTDEIRFLGMIVDRQQDCYKWDIHAHTWDGRIILLDWGRVHEMDDLPAIADTRIFTDKSGGEWEVVLIYLDTQYRKHDCYRFLAEQNQVAAFTGGGLPRWEGIAGRDVENTRAARIVPHWVKEYPVLDDSGAATTLMVRIHNINADHYEGQLHIERIAKYGTEYYKGPDLWLPSDTPDDYLAELTNAEQYHTKPDKGGIRDLRWRKRHSDEPNDRADTARYAIVMDDAVNEEETG